ncbi:GNAT family N-acetyltransferase [Ectobacillus antri]|jgi:ribosomal protein S18 acetylase RimI-like enzyme|uniref:GNAT family N-acetyltransferase n=1 Tax=Ectobacillus antri TaxID=2486280 RepID=A0ABT6H644_9BACI|nr:GNAT family N-acetyltransferase [Ectobacillus antri]MDG4657043.1 GNAT family N-acetyltransferase [Ectobacillus antri]MDG5754145.1 GNAT family N-acetyltransferase [Ectobacillus antri]
MIRSIDVLHIQTAKALWNLQRTSYAVEAELIGFNEIPPLHESLEELQACGEIFLGYYIETQLAGAISYTVESQELTICRLVVHPTYFKKGIATKLLSNLIEKQPYPVYYVSTARDNIPAICFYKANGFCWINDIEVVPNFYISCFKKEKKTTP